MANRLQELEVAIVERRRAGRAAGWRRGERLPSARCGACCAAIVAPKERPLSVSQDSAYPPTALGVRRWHEAENSSSLVDRNNYA
jgi:hypothetical protein